MKNILIISPEHWNSHFVSKHHYAITLSEAGYNVYFLNPPEDSLKRLLIIREKQYKNIHIIRGPRVGIGLRFLPGFIKNIIEAKWLLGLEKIINCRIDIIWLFENSRFFDMRFAKERLKIYHQVDLNQNFNVAIAATTADICFCTTDFIKRVLQSYNSKVFKIHHGSPRYIDNQKFINNENERFLKNGLNAIYIGNLDIEYLDIDLLVGAVRKFPNVRFHFVGECRESSELLRLTAENSNVVYWGRVPSSLVGNILSKADILLVAYKAEEFREQLANPHKLMEYLSSGKVIVSTYTAEYEPYRHLVEMVDTRSEYLFLLNKIISNIEKYNNDILSKKRKEFAAANSYENQFEIIKIILKNFQLI